MQLLLQYSSLVRAVKFKVQVSTKRDFKSRSVVVSLPPPFLLQPQPPALLLLCLENTLLLRTGRKIKPAQNIRARSMKVLYEVESEKKIYILSKR